MLYSSLVQSNEIYDINHAKKIADKNENSLKGENAIRLLEAQTLMVKSIMPKCINSTRSNPDKSFLVVVKINKNGNPDKSWLKGKYPFSQCFEKGMKNELYFVPKEAPFYTSFDYKLKP